MCHSMTAKGADICKVDAGCLSLHNIETWLAGQLYPPSVNPGLYVAVGRAAEDMLPGCIRRQYAAIECGLSRLPRLIVVLCLSQLAVMKDEARKIACAWISLLWIGCSSLTFIQVRLKTGL